MDSRTLEKLIETAAMSSADADFRNLFKSLRGVEVFFNIIREPARPGASQAEIDAAPMSAPMALLGNGLHVIVVFVSKGNPKLRPPFGGLVWEEALEMVMQVPTADGLLVEGADQQWVAIKRSVVAQLLGPARPS